MEGIAFTVMLNLLSSLPLQHFWIKMTIALRLIIIGSDTYSILLIICCCIVIYFFLDPFIASEYNSVPKIAIDDPMIEPVLMGVLNAITEATMMTTRLMVLPTA